MSRRKVEFNHYGVVINNTVDVMSGRRVIELNADDDVGLTAGQAKIVARALDRARLYLYEADYAAYRKRLHARGLA